MTQQDDRPSNLAPYAVADQASRGRTYPEQAASDESPFELDRQRILNCTAFRRLMHKTQVFVTDSGDHFRTRLTHTLEVSAQAQRLAKLLRLNHRLAGAIALAHDLGHPPFGHAGEGALAELMAGHGGFEHNRQSLRVVDYLEHPYPSYRGLNLSFELRESLIKHSTPYDRPQGNPGDDPLVQPLLAAGPMPPLEGQVASLADLVAYTLHDIEDGLGEEILREDVLNNSVIWREAAEPIRKAFPTHSLHAVRRPILEHLASRLNEDAAAESLRRLQEASVAGVDAVRRHERELIAFSTRMSDGLKQLQDLLLQWVYHNHRVARMDFTAKRLIRELFGAYLTDHRLLPERFGRRVAEQGPHRVICDYVAGMTDRFCRQEHRRLFAPFQFG
jgi:dGTPase